jgi:hypothetical protein
MARRAEITQRVLEVIPAEHQISFETAMLHWWQNLRAEGGLRLTDAGVIAFRDHAELECYTHELPTKQPLTKLMLLKLDRSITMPYYIGPKRTIVFFGSREAMMAALYGDLAKYIQNLST